MKYFVVADPHGFFTLMHNAILSQGFDEDNPDHKLIICGDLMDRGKEAREMQSYILTLLEKNKAILIRGNHEDLMLDMIEEIRCNPIAINYSHHITNGTFDTARQLANIKYMDLYGDVISVAKSISSTPFVSKIIPQMRNYYETKHYIFVHGWVPLEYDDNLKKYYIQDIKKASNIEWTQARWINGIDMAVNCGLKLLNKTIVCGHWHTSYGHKLVGKIQHEFGDDEDFSPFYGDGIIALDACTSYSKKINCIVIDD